MKRLIVILFLALLMVDCKSTPSRLPGGENLPQIAHDIAIAIRYKQKERLRSLLENRQDEIYAFNNPLCVNKNCLYEALSTLQIDWKANEAGEDVLGKKEAATLLIRATPTAELSRSEQALLDALLNDDSEFVFSEDGKFLAKFFAGGVDFSTVVYRYKFKPRTNLYQERTYDIDALEYICLKYTEAGHPKFPYPKGRVLRTDLVGRGYTETEYKASGGADHYVRYVDSACTNYLYSHLDGRGQILPIREIEPAIIEYKAKQANEAQMAELSKKLGKSQKSQTGENAKDRICLSYKLDGSLICSTAPVNSVICPKPRSWIGHGPCSKYTKLTVAQLDSDWKDLKSSYEFRKEFGENPDISGQNVNTCFAKCMADCDKRFGTASITKKESYGRSSCTSSCTSSCPSK